MQRWIAIAAVAMALLMGGGAYGYRLIKQNRNQPMWVPLPINPELTGEKRDEIAKDLESKLKTEEKMLQVSKDLKLAEAWGLPSAEEAAKLLKRRVFVKVGETTSDTNTVVPSINFGVLGKAKEKELSGKIAMRLMDDVWELVGVKPPPKKDF
jgi:hypothetical protein